MKELFVSYELAVKLKEKGFNEPVIAGYDVDDFKLYSIVNETAILQGVLTHSLMSVIAAPMYQQVVDWFREKHGLLIYVHENACQYESVIQNTKLSFHCFVSVVYLKYYEALDVAIEKALTLI